VLRSCLRPGCPELVPAGYCARHAPASSLRETDSTARGYGHRWTDLSRAYRRAHPICELCNQRRSQLVHHKDGLGPNGPRGYDPSNLIAVCRKCHQGEHKKLRRLGLAPTPAPTPAPPRTHPTRHPHPAHA
jgi:5-methylcytosine-specific restriction protein A